jgi:hypothetical protein
MVTSHFFTATLAGLWAENRFWTFINVQNAKNQKRLGEIRVFLMGALLFKILPSGKDGQLCSRV